MDGVACSGWSQQSCAHLAASTGASIPAVDESLLRSAGHYFQMHPGNVSQPVEFVQLSLQMLFLLLNMLAGLYSERELRHQGSNPTATALLTQKAIRQASRGKVVADIGMLSC